ncbi:MAG: PTS sugar transporter subunit IIA [Planctomycetes bacterium]|nr:PTS sugar transporter subunit IIA [Planctomycetota bacterium]
MPTLAALLRPEAVVDLDAAHAEDALHALASSALDLVDDGLTLDELLQAIYEREKLHSTALGEGVAMPHVRLKQVKAFRTVLGRSRGGIEFAAPDGQAVRLFLMIVGPEALADQYRKLMTRAARFLRNEAANLLESDDFAAAARAALEDY